MQSKVTKDNSLTPISHDFDVRQTKLDNGLVVVTEKMNHVRSVSFGFFLRDGSRQEAESQHGLTHFIEHALFKGTEKRTAAQIAAETDVLGGNLDAFTGREIVGFYNKVLDEHLPRAFELIADLVTAPAFVPVELEKERNVILEEIKMVEDTPDDVINDIFCENFYPNHPLGRPVLGTPETVASFTPQMVREYYDYIYRPDNCLIAAAGNLEHDQLVELADQHYGRMKPRAAAKMSPPPAAAAPIILRLKAELEQSHLLLGAPGPSVTDENLYAASLLSIILGGGMSSRLFQSVREDRGLVYSISSSTSPFNDCGYLNIYAAASTEQLEETIEATMEELQAIKEDSVDEEELQRNKDQLKASLMLNLESSSARMSALATDEMIYGRFISPQEIIAKVEEVSAGDIQMAAREIFKPESLAAVVLGDLDGFELERAQLQC